MNRHSILPRLSVNRPVTVLMIFLALTVVGIVAYSDIPIELFPKGFVFPALGIWVPYNNANPSEIEEQIARPIEEIVQTIHGVRRVETSSRNNGCWTWIEFAGKTDMDVAYADLRDRIDRVKPELPDDIERIYPRKFSDDDEEIVFMAVSMDKQYEDAYSLLDTHLRKVLNRIDGVANVELWGVDRKAVQVLVDQASVDAHNINLRLKDIAEVKFDVAEDKRWIQRFDASPRFGWASLKNRKPTPSRSATTCWRCSTNRCARTRCSPA